MCCFPILYPSSHLLYIHYIPYIPLQVSHVHYNPIKKPQPPSKCNSQPPHLSPFSALSQLHLLSSHVKNATAQQERLCTSAIDTAMCCQTTLAGVINQTCTTPAITPINKQAFRAYCAAQGQDSSCCKTPLVGDGVICTPP
ncbi:fungal hydrophobin [Botrytis cinerea]